MAIMIAIFIGVIGMFIGLDETLIKAITSLIVVALILLVLAYMSGLI